MSRTNTAALRARPPRISKAKRNVTRPAGKGTSPRRSEPRMQLAFGRVAEVSERSVFVEVLGWAPGARPARSLVAHTDLQPDDKVVVARLGAELGLVVLGRLFDPLAPPRDVRVNGRKVSIEANSELILKCSSATIKIAHDGLVAIRGDRVVTQANGVNRIRGGSVEIN